MSTEKSKEQNWVSDEYKATMFILTNGGED